MSFRLWTIFYVFALVAAAMATFGGWGVAVAGIVCGVWISLNQTPRNTGVAVSLLAVLSCGFLFAIVAPGFDFGPGMREASRRSQCLSQMKQLAIATLNYESARRKFPAAYIANSNGTLLLSWRAQVHPYLEMCYVGPSFDLSKSWDDPVNRPFSTVATTDLLQCPAHPFSGTVTDYYAVVDPRTAFPGAAGRRTSELKDGATNTIFFVETQGPQANWAEPRDLSFDEAISLLCQPVSENDGHRQSHGFFYKPSYVRCVAFADGHAEMVGGPLSRDVATSLLTVDGGEAIPDDWNKAPRGELDYGKCYVFGLFVGLSLLPMPWTFLRAKHIANQVTPAAAEVV